MKPILVFVATFVVALGASTGAKLALTKPPAKAAADSSGHVADSTHRADSTHADTAAASGSAPTPPADSAAKRAATTSDRSKANTSAPNAGAPTQPGAPQSVAAKPGAPGPAPTQQAAAKAPPDTAVEASERRIAKVFTSMDAKQAAKVLDHMADSDVEIILGYVGPRQAASIMAELPPERVATLSKLAMQGKTK
jgi:hypothetical protein